MAGLTGRTTTLNPATNLVRVAVEYGHPEVRAFGPPLARLVAVYLAIEHI